MSLQKKILCEEILTEELGFVLLSDGEEFCVTYLPERVVVEITGEYEMDGEVHQYTAPVLQLEDDGEFYVSPAIEREIAENIAEVVCSVDEIAV